MTEIKINPILAFIWEFVETIAVSISIFFILYLFVFQPHQVKGLSMFPTFHDGDYLLTNKFIYRLHPPQRGDIIIFRAPYHEDTDYIKRIIGLPGDRIKIIDKKFYVNGEKLDESKYLSPDVITFGETYLREGQEVIVPPNNYFTAGDNRPHSSDSRDYGPVPYANIIGKAWIRYWPPNRAGIIDHSNK